eukprot:2817627-Amphidinium_carterae.2
MGKLYRGAFQTDANYHELLAAVRHLRSAQTSGFVLFQLLVEELAVESGVVRSGETVSLDQEQNSKPPAGGPRSFLDNISDSSGISWFNSHVVAVEDGSLRREWAVRSSNRLATYIEDQMHYVFSAEFADRAGLVSACRKGVADLARLCESSWTLTRNFVAELLKSHLVFQSPPLCFLGLLDDDKDVVDKCLSALQRAHANLSRIEVESLTNPSLASYLQRLRISDILWVRDMFIQLQDI